MQECHVSVTMRRAAVTSVSIARYRFRFVPPYLPKTGALTLRQADFTQE